MCPEDSDELSTRDLLTEFKLSRGDCIAKAWQVSVAAQVLKLSEIKLKGMQELIPPFPIVCRVFMQLSRVSHRQDHKFMICMSDALSVDGIIMHFSPTRKYIWGICSRSFPPKDMIPKKIAIIPIPLIYFSWWCVGDGYDTRHNWLEETSHRTPHEHLPLLLPTTSQYSHFVVNFFITSAFALLKKNIIDWWILYKSIFWSIRFLWNW